MSDQLQDGWKKQTYGIGGIAGLAFGLITAYLYIRAAEEDAIRSGGKPARISTAQLLGLALTLVGLIRQIAESGKAKK